MKCNLSSKKKGLTKIYIPARKIYICSSWSIIFLCKNNGAVLVEGTFSLLYGVNFINVKHTWFSYKNLAPKISNPKYSFLTKFWRQKLAFVQKNARVKRWWNWHMISYDFSAFVIRNIKGSSSHLLKLLQKDKSFVKWLSNLRGFEQPKQICWKLRKIWILTGIKKNTHFLWILLKCLINCFKMKWKHKRILEKNFLVFTCLKNWRI